MPPNDDDRYFTPDPSPSRRRGRQDYDEDAALDLIAHHESGGRNVKQQIVPAGGGFNPSVGRVTGPSTAQGPWQITNTTWRKRAPREIAEKYPTAMAAPVEVQREVARKIFRETGFQDWAPYNASLRRAIARAEQPQQKPQPQSQSQSDPYFTPEPEQPRSRSTAPPITQPAPVTTGRFAGMARARQSPRRQLRGARPLPVDPVELASQVGGSVVDAALGQRKDIRDQIRRGLVARNQAAGINPTPQQIEEEVGRTAETVGAKFEEQARMQAQRPEIERIKAKLRGFAEPGARQQTAEGVFGISAEAGAQAGNLIQLVTGGRRGGDLTQQMRLAQQALAELEAEDPDKGWGALARRTLPQAAGEFGKMYMLGRAGAGKATLPVLGALSGADEGKAIEGAITGALYQKGFEKIAPLSRPAKAAIGVAGPTAVSVAQGEDVSKALLSNLAFAPMAIAEKVPTRRQLMPMPEVRTRTAAPPVRPSELQKRVALRGEVTSEPINRPVDSMAVQPPVGTEQVASAVPDVRLPLRIHESAPELTRGVSRETQIETQPPVQARVEGEKPRGAVETPVVETGKGATPMVGERAQPTAERPVEPVKPQWQHRDFGLITEAYNQAGIGRGRVRVTAEDGSEHVIQRPKGTGAGNQIAIPVRESSPPSVAGEGKAPAWEVGKVLNEQESQQRVQQIRAGDPRSKNEGRINSELPTGKLQQVELPVDGFAPEYLEYLRESTNADRVTRYVTESPDTPIYATPGKRGENKGKWTISDGGHRLLAAIERGDKTVRALVPEGSYTPKPLLDMSRAQVRRFATGDTAATFGNIHDSARFRSQLEKAGIEYKEAFAKGGKAIRYTFKEPAAPQPPEAAAPPVAVSQAQEMFYDRIRARDRKDYDQKVAFVEGYLSLDKERAQISDRMSGYESDHPQYRLLDKRLDEIDRALNLQVDQGTKRFKITPDEFVTLVNEFESNKAATVSALSPQSPASRQGGPTEPATPLPTAVKPAQSPVQEAASQGETASIPARQFKKLEGLSQQQLNSYRSKLTKQLLESSSNEELFNSLSREIARVDEAKRSSRERAMEIVDREIKKPRPLDDDTVRRVRNTRPLWENRFSEEVNRKLLAQFRGKDGRKYIVKRSPNTNTFRVYNDKLEKVAEATFDVGNVYGREGDQRFFSGFASAESINVNPEYRRQGIATAITDFAEKQYNAPYRPNFHGALSTEMQAFVRSRQSPPTASSAPPIKPVEAAKAPEPKLPETTSVKNAATAELRRDLELLELEGPERKSWQTTIDNALAKGLDKKAEEIADRVIKSERKEGLSDEEAAGVQHRLRELENEFETRYKANSADPKLSDLKARIANLTKATNEGGTAPARALNFRRSAIDKEFRLINVITRMEAAKGRELNPKELSRYEDMVKQRDQAIQQRDAALEKARTAQIQKQIDRVARQRTRAETKEALDAEAATIKQNIAAEFAKLRSQNIQASGLAGLDPEGVITKNLLRYARNRVKANVGIKAEQLIDDVHSLVKDFVDRRQVAELISGYKLQVPERQPEDVRRLSEIRSEIKRLLTAEDVAKGIVTERTQGPSRRFVSRNEQRLKQLQKQEADLARRIEQRDFSKPEKAEPLPYTRAVAEQQRRVEQIERQFAQEQYRALRSTGGKITDELAKAANVPKTIKSIGDISAVFRQGGYLAITHPVKGGVLPFRDMIRSFTDAGFRTVVDKIKADPTYEQLKKSGVEFTGVEKDNPNLSLREEGFLGKEYLDYVPVARQIKDFSERTFVSFLDAQRLYVGKQMFRGLTDPGIVARTLGARAGRSRAELAEDQRRIAKLLNSATGRGNLSAKGNQVTPVLNIAMFSPRLLKSRIELLNNMFNPVAIYNMPRNARAQIVADNVKFLAATAAVLTLAKAAGAEVNLDPDDGDYLKIRVGDTTYDTLTGLQQPFRYLANMGRAMSPISSRALQAGGYYAGRSPWEMTVGTKTRGGFLESKASPSLGVGIEQVRGTDFLGRKRTVTSRAIDIVKPLIIKDFIEAAKQEGLIGIVKAAPAVTGIGVTSYPAPQEKPQTVAEKMARNLRPRGKEQGRTEEEIEVGREISDVRARARRGEDVSASLPALNLTERQRSSIEDAAGKTRFQEDFTRLTFDDALKVWAVATAQEKAAAKDLLAKKVNNLDADKQAEARERLRSMGIVFSEVTGIEPREPSEPRKPVVQRSRISIQP